MTRRPFRVALLLAFLLLCVTFLASAAPPRILNARASTVQLVKVAAGAWRAYCTAGVLRTPQGNRVITAGHCVDDPPPEGLFLRDHRGFIYPARIEHTEMLLEDGPGGRGWVDYAVLRSSAQHVLPALEPAQRVMTPGDRVFAWSGPLGLEPLLMTGRFVGRFFFAGSGRGNGLRVIDINGDGGSSGSLVMNERGRVVGIVSLGFTTSVKLDGLLLVDLPPGNS